MTLNKQYPWTVALASLPVVWMIIINYILARKRKTTQYDTVKLNQLKPKHGNVHVSRHTRRQTEVCFQPDVIPCGWLGSKHQLTNLLTSRHGTWKSCEYKPASQLVENTMNEESMLLFCGKKQSDPYVLIWSNKTAACVMLWFCRMEWFGAHVVISIGTVRMGHCEKNMFWIYCPEQLLFNGWVCLCSEQNGNLRDFGIVESPALSIVRLGVGITCW